MAINADNGRAIEGFGTNGIVDLTLGLDRDVVEPGKIGSSSPAIVINDVVVMGCRLAARWLATQQDERAWPHPRL